MSSDEVREIAFGIGVVLLALVIIASPFAAVGWYKAGLQTEVYKRQGVTMTQWEVFIGCKPVERYITNSRGDTSPHE